MKYRVVIRGRDKQGRKYKDKVLVQAPEGAVASRAVRGILKRGETLGLVSPAGHQHRNLPDITNALREKGLLPEYPGPAPRSTSTRT